MLRSEPSVLQTMIVSGERVYKEVSSVRLLGWVLIQSDWCPYKRKCGHTEREQGSLHTEEKPREDPARRQHVQPRREASGETRPPTP